MSRRALGRRLFENKGGKLMKTESVLVALLVSGCMAQPAYIGEGPPSDTGGSGGSSGTGSSGTSGTASGGAGPGRRFESGSCTVEIHNRLAPESVVTKTFTWDADERLFESRWGSVAQFSRLDENGLIVETWSEEYPSMGRSSGVLRPRTFFEWDVRGTVTSGTIFYNDVEEPERWDQTNEYDDFERLVSSSIVGMSGTERVTEQIGYPPDGGLPDVILRQIVTADATIQNRFDLAHEEGRVVIDTATDSGDGVHIQRLTGWYDADGRLIAAEWDSGLTGPDGQPDSTEQWIYDDEGRIIRHESGDVSVFETACADIAVLPYHLYGMPVWLFPFVSTGGWRL
jgi:hypothetical protein